MLIMLRFGLVASLCLWGSVVAQQPETLPKTIEDILVQLKSLKPDEAILAQAAATLASDPPPGADRVALVNFYLARSLANRTRGTLEQMLQDTRKAAELARGMNNQLEWESLVELSAAEVLGGNYLNGIKARDEMSKARMYGGGGYAVSAYASAACLRADIGDLDRADQAINSADTLLSQLRFGESMSFWIGSVERCRSRVLRGKGKYTQAEMTLRVAISNTDKVIDTNQSSPYLPAPVRVEILRQREEFELADVLVDLGRLPEAEWHARSALQRMLKRIRGDSPEIPYGLVTMSNILYAEGRYSESRALATITRDMLAQSGALPVARDYLILVNQDARSLVALGQFASALDRYAEMRANLAASPALQRFLGGGDADWGLALIKTGKPDEAVEMLRPLLQELQERQGAEHPGTAIVQGELAMALASLGDKAGALTQFKTATNTLLLPQTLNTATPARTARIGLIVEAYIGLLAEMHFTTGNGRDADVADEAFRLADAIRGRSVQSAVAAAAVRMSAGTPVLGEITRKDQDLERELAALYDAINTQLSSPPDQQLPEIVARMRARIDAIGVERRNLSTAIQKDFPNYANLVMPKPATVDDARKALAPGEALISVLVTRTGTFVWAIPKTGAVAFAASQLTGADVNALVSSLRQNLDPGQVPIDQIPSLDLAAGYRLYSELLLKVEAGWRDAKSLLVVTNGALAQLPFALLPTKQEKPASDGQVPFTELKTVSWLVKRVAVTQLPSANALVTLRAVQAPTIERVPFIGFGDPQFSRAPVALAAGTRTARLRNLAVKRAPQEGTDTQFSTGQSFRTEVESADWVAYEGLAPLPDTRDEIVAIARALKADPERDAFFGPDASKQTVKRLDLSRRRVVAFATHGLLPGDLPNLTQPALALSQPVDPKESGLLTLTDILGLKLNADWVVLSACNTAAGDGAGAEAISGLGRGFFYAGSRSLLVTHWPVETVSAKMLVTGIFLRLAADPSLSRAEALRQSMLALMDEAVVDPATGHTTFAYAHPIFWAPYALVGDPGR